MANSTTILLHLLDADPTGRIKASIDGSHAIVYSVPRKSLHLCKDVSHMSHPGIYILINDDRLGEKTKIYIGQGDIRESGGGILDRVSYHAYEGKKDFRHVLFIVSENKEYLDNTRLCYLERAFYDIAREADRTTLVNRKAPSARPLRIEFQGAVDTFINDAILLIETLQRNFFTPMSEDNKTPTSTAEEGTRFYLKRATARGEGTLTNEGFLVYAGATLRPQLAPSAPESISRQREFFADRISDWKLIRDTAFSSPSAASNFLTGANTNGRAVWKTADNQTLGEYEKHLMLGEVDPALSKPKRGFKNQVKGANEDSSSNTGDLFTLAARGAEGTGFWSKDGQFIIKAGSRLNPDARPSIPAGALHVRQEKRNIIDASNVLIEDISFASLSMAAAFLVGMSANGRKLWKPSTNR